MPRGYINGKYRRAVAYFEFKAIRSKNRVYHYWYFRYLNGGVMHSVYVGKTRPAIDPLKAYDALKRGKKPFREPRSPLPKPP